MSSRFDAIISPDRNFASASNTPREPHDVAPAATSRRTHDVFLDAETHRAQAFDETRVGAGRPHTEHAARTEPGEHAREPITLIQPGVARL